VDVNYDRKFIDVMILDLFINYAFNKANVQTRNSCCIGRAECQAIELTHTLLASTICKPEQLFLKSSISPIPFLQYT